MNRHYDSKLAMHIPPTAEEIRQNVARREARAAAAMKDPDYRLAWDETCQEMEPVRALYAARAAAGFTQAQVAAIMGTTQAYVARIERGRNISMKTFYKYVDACGCTARLLVQPKPASAQPA